VLEKSGVVHSYKELFGQRALAWLKAVELEPVYRQAVESYLAVFKMIQAQIQQINAALRHEIRVTPQAQLLTTIPGISVFGALLILSEIGDIHRLPSSDHLCSYAGLVPSVYSSGGKTKHGRLTKQGSKYLRWMLVEAAIHAARKDQRLAALHKRVAAKHGTHSARIAVARQLLRVIYAMLKKNEGFRSGAH
jgi:transposase